MSKTQVLSSCYWHKNIKTAEFSLIIILCESNVNCCMYSSMNYSTRRGYFYFQQSSLLDRSPQMPHLHTAKILHPEHIQSEAARHLQGFEDKNMGSSPGLRAATVATYCPSRPGELPTFLLTKPHARRDAYECRFLSSAWKISKLDGVHE